MFDDFANEVLEAKIAGRSGQLKNCLSLGVITGIKEEKTRNGPMAVVDLLITKVTPRDPNDTNVVGEKVARTYPLYGTANKKSYFMGQLKKDMCHLAGVDYKTVTADQWKSIGAAAAAGSFNGIQVELAPYDFQTNGENRVGHNFSKVPGKNEAAEVVKRAEALAKGAGAEAFQ